MPRSPAPRIYFLLLTSFRRRLGWLRQRAQLRLIFGICRLGSAPGGVDGHAVAVREVAVERALARQVARPGAVRTTENLVDVFTRPEPVAAGALVEDEVFAADQRLGEIDRVGPDLEVRHDGAVPDEVLDHRGLLAV